MSELILHLCKEILGLAEAQKEAILGGKFDELMELQEKRRRIIEKIQKIDRVGATDSEDGKNDLLEEKFSRKMNATTKKTLSIDREIQSIIQQELHSLIDSMETVHKLKKAFCSSTALHQAGQKLNLSA